MCRKYGLFIGLESYQNVNTFGQVRCAEADATSVADTFLRHGYSEEDRVVLLSANATKTTIEHHLRQITDYLGREDYFVFFYAGHGFAREGVNYITAHDTHIDDPINTSISLQSIFTMVNDSQCKHVLVLLDACHSGVQIESSMRNLHSDWLNTEIKHLYENAEYQVAFASCKTGESSYSTPALGHGIWTHFLLRALNGDDLRPLTKGGLLTADSLQNYLQSEVPAVARNAFATPKKQTPCMFGRKTSDFVVANVQPILDARQPADNNEDYSVLNNTYLAGETNGAIKSLSGFVKGKHTIPRFVGSAVTKFLNSISERELEEIGNDYYERIKDAFQYKRKEIDLSISGGAVSIRTTDFDLNVDIGINSVSPSEYIIKFSLVPADGPKIIMDQRLNDIFDNVFSSIVLEFREHINLEDVVDLLEEHDELFDVKYPSDVSECTIKSKDKGNLTFIKLTENSVAFSRIKPCRPEELVRDMFHLRQGFIAVGALRNTHVPLLSN